MVSRWKKKSRKWPREKGGHEKLMCESEREKGGKKRRNWKAKEKGAILRKTNV